MECPKLTRIMICGSDMFDIMVSQIDILEKFCFSGNHRRCPSYVEFTTHFSEEKKIASKPDPQPKIGVSLELLLEQYNPKKEVKNE